MAVKAKISTSGFDKAFEAIRKAGGNIEAAADRALLAGGGVLVSGMRRRVRKDTHNLEEHIEIDGPDAAGTLRFIEVGLVSADAETARYGSANEYGTVSMGAQSFIRATMDEDGKAARKAMAESLRRDGAI